ncbi:hypothetical protein [Streptomonospora wellingtoniae]|uniref:Lipoprotein n=1 Tax=Streptomonospora wellingtoniae TaxID=3075544 RepID=A0ABU2KT81_9ACTN|nr:hypothetical protein [Streptomonospora sp. DSM 45055]MDT0302472.1 hypothetical protein [Streptomonospora sp. DSM 45055]
MKRAVGAAAVVAAIAGLVAGCGGDDGGSGGSGGSGGVPTSDPPTSDAGGSAAPSPEQAAEGGMNGVWKSTADGGGVRTLTVVGGKVRTEGDPACPGTLDPVESGSTARVELDCEASGPGPEAGTAALNAEDDHLIVTWDGTDGMPQAFTRTEEEPVIAE